MDFEWKDEYKTLASAFIKQHFGSGRGITKCFPCMRVDYPWGKHRPDVIDSRVPAKNNTEYHGLERHAMQYHVTAQYDYAYHHWLMAAYWRHLDMVANNFNDQPHLNAISYCLKHAFYNKALNNWQNEGAGVAPQPQSFLLTQRDLDKKELEATQQLENAGAI